MKRGRNVDGKGIYNPMVFKVVVFIKFNLTVGQIYSA